MTNDIPKRRTFHDISPQLGDEMRAEAARCKKARWDAAHKEGSKICTKCSQKKDLDTSFRRDTGYKDGHENTCISCRNLVVRTRKRKRDARRKMEAH